MAGCLNRFSELSLEVRARQQRINDNHSLALAPAGIHIPSRKKYINLRRAKFNLHYSTTSVGFNYAFRIERN